MAQKAMTRPIEKSLNLRSAFIALASMDSGLVDLRSRKKYPAAMTRKTIKVKTCQTIPDIRKSLPSLRCVMLLFEVAAKAPPVACRTRARMSAVMKI